MLHFDQYGHKGTPIIILHGLFGSAINWRHIARHLSTDHTVTVPDLRNHGQSPWSETMNYPAMATDVVDLITHLELDHPVLIGHSMGGKVAMTLAQQEKIKLSALIIIDIAPVSYTNQDEYGVFIEAMQQLPLTTLTSRRQADQILTDSIQQQQIRQFLLQNLVTSESGYRWRVNLDAIKYNLDQIMAYLDPEATYFPYPGYTVFIRGALSHYIEQSSLAKIAKYFPNTALKTIENSGHWLHVEQPAKLIQLLRACIVTMESTNSYA